MANQRWTTHPNEIEQSGISIGRTSDIWKVCQFANIPKHGYLIIADIDGFSDINAKLGHDAGDDILLKIWTANQRMLQASNGFGIRYSGNGFLMLVDRQGNGLVDFVRSQLSSFEVEKFGPLYRSLGISLITETQSPEDWLEIASRADRALQEGKNRGGNMSLLFEDTDKYKLLASGPPSRRIYSGKRSS